MTNFWKKLFGNKNTDTVTQVAKKQLEENIGVIKSLRDYDEGKKDISTADIERRVPNLRVAPRR
jgi:hypothetical protein